jgi:uncharacterized protein (DUF1697 family)
MGADFVAFLRGISNVPMQPFRDALVGIGLTDVRSFGGTGNLLFRADYVDCQALERRIAGAVGAEAFIRTHSEMTAIVTGDPFTGRPGAGVFFSHVPLETQRTASLMAGGFEGEPPVVSGAQLYFVHPLRRTGRKSIIDLESELDVRGTMRASRVVTRVLELM